MKKLLKILGILVLSVIVLLTALVLWSQHSTQKRLQEQAARPTRDPNELNFVMEDSAEPLEILTSRTSTLNGQLTLYEAEDYDLFFPQKHVSAADCKKRIQTNDQIPDRFKSLLSWFADAIEAHYPEADLRPLYYNLETLEIREVDDRGLLMASLSADSNGCYVRTENRIYVPEDYEYQPGTWAYQVIIHEFGHAARTVQRDKDHGNVLIYALPPEVGFIVIDEALNSLFTVSLFDYEEPDIAYQFQSNLFQILLECLDGVDAGDYLNHSIAWFAHAFDLENGNNNYAMNLFRLIQAQFDDYHSEEPHRPQSVYYPIYDYVTKMYLDQYGTANMSPEAKRALVQQMLDRLLFDVPEEYEIDTEEFFRFAESYTVPGS